MAWGAEVAAPAGQVAPALALEDLATTRVPATPTRGAASATVTGTN